MTDGEEELERIKRKRLEEMKRRVIKQEATGPKEPVELTEATFQETVRNYPLVVVDCWAPWCAPCRMVAPVIQEMARDYAGRVVFGKLNVDQNGGVARKYQIMSIPTLLVFKQGELVDRIVGAMPRKLLEPKITRHL